MQVAANDANVLTSAKRALWGALELGLTDACKAGAKELVGVWGRDPGKAAGAPANPRLLFKAVMTTLIAGIIWFFVYWAVNAGLINFRS